MRLMASPMSGASESVRVGTFAKGRATARGLCKNFGITAPRLAFAGLNPHAGESGHLGREELDVIIPLLAQLRTNMHGHERTTVALEGRRHAAVAVVVVASPSPAILLTKRASTLRAHGGQWALPGGRLDPGEDATAAALRELREELGLNCEPDAVLGLLDDYPTRSGYLISPVVVWTVCPFWTICTDSVPVSGPAFGSCVIVTCAMSGVR